MPSTPPYRADHVGSLLRPAAVKAARKRFAEKPITADEARGDPFVEQHLDRAFLPFERRLANADEPGIGLEADEQVVALPGIGDQRFEGRDLHA